MGFNYSKSTDPRVVINVKDIPKLEEKIKALKGTPGFMATKTAYTGPDKGIEYDDDTDKINICTGWAANENGDIVKQ